jgi:hypothetical protein
MADIVLDQNLIILNTGEPTYMGPRGHFTHIDLSICSRDIGHHFLWQTYEDMMDSDHFPIVIQTDFQGSISDSQPRWNIRNAKWSKFKSDINFPSLTNDVEDGWTKIKQEIIGSAAINIGKVRTVRDPN